MSPWVIIGDFWVEPTFSETKVPKEIKVLDFFLSLGGNIKGALFLPSVYIFQI